MAVSGFYNQTQFLAFIYGFFLVFFTAVCVFHAICSLLFVFFVRINHSYLYGSLEFSTVKSVYAMFHSLRVCVFADIHPPKSIPVQ